MYKIQFTNKKKNMKVIIDVFAEFLSNNIMFIPGHCVTLEYHVASILHIQFAAFFFNFI